MPKRIIFILFNLLIISHLCQAQTPDSLQSISEDSVFVEESLTDKICSLFTTNYFISSEDIENSIYRTLGDVLKMNRAIDVTNYGSYGQPEFATLWGSTSRQFLIYQDDISFFQQALYIPQTGDFDLFTVSLENIESIQIIDNPVANILGQGVGLGGLRLKSKGLKTELPFSRINYERGPYGYRRSQIDFGRDITRKTSFYFTYGRKKSDGDVENSDFKSLYLTGALDYRLRNNWKAELKAYHYENRTGNPLPYDSTTALRIRNDRWILDFNSDYRFKNSSSLKIETFYSHNSAKSYMGGYFLDRQLKEDECYLKGSYEFNRKKKSQMKVEGFFDWGDLNFDDAKKSFKRGYLSVLELSRLFDTFDIFAFFRLDLQKGFRWNLSVVEGISYQPNENLTLFANFLRTISNPPTLFDLYLGRSCYSVSSDSFYFSYQEYFARSLDAEHIFSANAGVKWAKDDFSLNASFLYSWNQDKIVWIYSRTVDQLPSYTSIRYRYYPTNRGEESFGANLILNYRFSPDFQSGFSYAYKWTRTEDDYKIPCVPAHSFFSYFQYSKEYIKKRYEIKLRLEQEYLSSRFLADYNQDEVPFVLLFNSKITLRFLDFRFYYVIENITNEVYRTRGDYDMPGRTLWFGFSWNFYD